MTCRQESSGPQMRYPETKTQTEEYLRLAIPMMARHGLATHPVSYAVCYEYVTGRNEALTREIDALLEHGAALDDKVLADLYLRHVSECGGEQMKRLQDGMFDVLTDMNESAMIADQEAGRFDDSLEHYGHELEGETNPAGAPAVLGGLSDATSSMRGAIASLQAQLSESRGQVRKLRDELMQVKEEVARDPLTGLANRNGLDLALQAAVPDDDEGHVCLVLFDIDRFKRVNDTYGHLFGDKVIRFVGTTIRKRVKGGDTAARYGGEEFAVVLPDTPLEGAMSVAEEIRRHVEQGQIQRSGDEKPVDRITVSAGVARHRPGESLEELIARADRALYQSKNTGRNRVSPEEPS